MKYFFTLFVLILSLTVRSQVSITDVRGCNSYTLTATVTGTTPTDIGLYSDDSYSGVLPIGFTFDFYGAPQTQFLVGENGCICFNLALAGGYNPWPISAPLLGNSSAYNSICAPWCDIDGLIAHQPIYYSLQGTAPNRSMAITWCGIYMFGCTTQWITMQIIMYETSNVIETHIAHKTICATWNGGYAIIGVQNAAGTVATTAPGRDYPSVYTCTNEAWRFTPTAGPSYSVAPIAYAPIPYSTSTIYWYDSATHAFLGTGPTITVTSTTSTTYEAVALGCNDSTKAFIHLPAAGCLRAINNDPCLGDTLYLGGVGDSTGSTYLWTGPSGFTSTLQYPFIYPATTGSGGKYVVQQFVGGALYSSDSTWVVVHPIPVVTASSNGPLCIGVGATLNLSANLDSLFETFDWSGPAGFTSTLQNPTVSSFNLPNAGYYKVVGTTIWGCPDSSTVNVGVVPIPDAPTITGIQQYCYGAPPVPFTVGGVNILWYPTSSGTTGSSTAPVVPTTTPGTYTYYATQTNGCLSPEDSITVIVYPRIDPNFFPTIHRACNEDSVTFVNLTSNALSYKWDFNDGTTLIDPTAALLTHTHVYPKQNLYNVTLTAYNQVCSGDTTIPVDTRHTVQAAFSPTPDTLCFGSPITFNDLSQTSLQGVAGAGLITNYAWNYGNGSTDNTISPTYTYPAPGAYPVTLTVTDSINCTSTATNNVYVIQISLQTIHDTTLCISQPLPMTNIITQVPDLGLTDYTYNWSPQTGLSDASAQSPFFDAIGSFNYTITDVLLPFNCIATDNSIVNSVAGAPVTNVTASQTIPYGGSVQLNSDNEVIYYWTPNDGTLSNNNINNPVATPEHTTTYMVYGYDVNGCLDSAATTVFVDSSTSTGIPTAFTPNGDGLNDVFKPEGIKFQNMVDFRIFNRWGVMVFNTNNKEVGWDGTYNGAQQDMGTYSYLIIVAQPGGNNITYKGTVTLIR